MTSEENLADLERHERDFEARTGFTYSVLEPSDGDLIGCVYIYPSPDVAHDASVSSWVRVTHARLDLPLWHAVSEWLDRAWPFTTVEYASRVADDVV